jgi:hypothetical protein
LELIGSGRMELLGLMPGASNYTFLARLTGGDAEALVVYKPRAGEAPLWDFPAGTLCQREVAAFVLADTLGWPPVPPTTMRDGPHGPGSVQLFVHADFDEHFFTLRRANADRFRAVAAFDVIANNADRKGGHCLLAEDGTIWVIDHGVCFAVEPKLRSVIWDFAGQPLPEPLQTDVTRVAGELRSGTLRGRLLALLSESEVDATAARAERLARAAAFPHPEGDRPYPWPPV